MIYWKHPRWRIIFSPPFCLAPTATARCKNCTNTRTGDFLRTGRLFKFTRKAKQSDTFCRLQMEWHGACIDVRWLTRNNHRTEENYYERIKYLQDNDHDHHRRTGLRAEMFYERTGDSSGRHRLRAAIGVAQSLPPPGAQATLNPPNSCIEVQLFRRNRRYGGGTGAGFLRGWFRRGHECQWMIAYQKFESFVRRNQPHGAQAVAENHQRLFLYE
jgi:hypothetical protein